MDNIDNMENKNDEKKKKKLDRIPDNIYKTIHNLYNLTYFQKHSSDILNGIIITIIILLGVSYNYIKINSASIVADWNNQKCKPGIMPFAGIINPPKDGSSASDFTISNFKSCMNNIFKDIGDDATAPVNFIINMIKDLFDMIKNMINAIRNFVNYLRVAAQNIFQEIMGKLLNIFVELQTFMIAMKDLFGKIQGVMTTVLYLSISTYYTMKSSIGAFYELIVIILLIMAVIVLILWIVPFTWGVAAAGLVIFLAISIPLAIIAAVMAEAFDLSLSGMPGAPTCFGENTELEMNDGSFKNIKHIKIDDVLKNNNRVISTFKCSAKYETFYNINNVIVSGSHYIIDNNKCVLVSNYKHAIKEKYTGKYSYCLTTTSKKIEVNNTLFLDFDDLKLDTQEFLERREIYNINKLVDAGFFKNTKIKMYDGSNKEIQNIRIGDRLDYDNIVLGIVRLHSNNIESKNYYILNKNFISENNLYYDNDIIKLIKTKQLNTDVNINDYLYHLVTSKGYFFIENLKMVHYSNLIDIYIKNNE